MVQAYPAHIAEVGGRWAQGKPGLHGVFQVSRERRGGEREEGGRKDRRGKFSK